MDITADLFSIGYRCLDKYPKQIQWTTDPLPMSDGQTMQAQILQVSNEPHKNKFMPSVRLSSRFKDDMDDSYINGETESLGKYDTMEEACQAISKRFIS